jgi:DNA-binding NarL/FixJ family response regulator
VGFDLDWARSLAAAERLLAGAASDAILPDAILLDLGLPDSPRKQTFASVKALAPAAPVLVLATFDDERESASVLEQGAAEYLVKGESLVDCLPAAIRGAIERQQAAPLERRRDAIAVPAETAEARGYRLPHAP